MNTLLFINPEKSFQAVCMYSITRRFCNITILAGRKCSISAGFP